MRALALEHLVSNSVGVYGDVLLDRGIEVNRVRLDLGEPLPDWRDYDLLVVMGGGMSAYEDHLYPWLAAEKRAIREAVEAGLPYFGVCLGSQLLASALGARVFKGPEPELGVSPVLLCDAARSDPVFRGFPPDLEVFEWHSDTFDLPEGAVRLARSSRYENQAIRFGQTAYAIQCHLETSLKDVQHWFDAWPSLGETFETRYGRGSLAEFLKEYERSVPLLQQTARRLFSSWLENALAHGRSPASANSGAAVSGQPLLGRARELNRIDRLLDEARARHSGTIVIRGETGMGKTAVLDAVAGRAQGLRVIRISGSEDLADRPYAGLEHLCRPLLDGIDALPATLRQALQATLGLAAAEKSDRLYAYAGGLWLLAAAAEKEPLLVCVDDAHLLDDASLMALTFIAGRIEAEGIALLIATGGDAARFHKAHVIELQPLDRGASLIHLKRLFGDELSPAVTAEVAQVACGNPLALREIPLSLAPDRRAGKAELGNALLTLGSAERAILARIATLAEKARRGLLVTALGHGENDATIARALQAAGVSLEELSQAEDARLVEIADGRVSFRHPIIRSTVRYSALRSEQRAAHAALAHATSSDSSIWHAARAATGPDETIAAALEGLAQRMVARMANLVAARALELSSRLSPDRAGRARRLVAAAEAAARFGHVYAAIDHVEAALPELDDAGSRAAADLLLGRLLARSGSAARARDLLVKGAARIERSDRAKAGRLLAAAVMPALRAGTPARAYEIAKQAHELAKEGPTEAAALIVLGTALTFIGDPDTGRAHLLRAAEFRDQLHSEPQMRAYLGAGFRLVGEFDRARDILVELIGNARSYGEFGLLPYALTRLADVDLDQGQWPAARASLTEAISLAREMGRAADLGLALGSLGSLDAAQGRAVDCRRRAGEAIALAQRLGAGSRLDRAVPGLGLLALGFGDLESAIEHFAHMRRMQSEQGWSDAAVLPHRTRGLVEALVGAGRIAEARDAISVFEQDVRRAKRPSALAALACCRGLVAGPDEVDAFFAESLSYGADVTGPFERARTLLDYGRRLREIGRPQDAVPHLTSALTAFTELRAEPWLAQALSELKASSAAPLTSITDAHAGAGDRKLQLALALARGETPEMAAEHLLLTVPTARHLWGNLLDRQ